MLFILPLYLFTSVSSYFGTQARSSASYIGLHRFFFFFFLFFFFFFFFFFFSSSSSSSPGESTWEDEVVLPKDYNIEGLMKILWAPENLHLHSLMRWTDCQVIGVVGEVISCTVGWRQLHTENYSVAATCRAPFQQVHFHRSESKYLTSLLLLILFYVFCVCLYTVFLGSPLAHNPTVIL